jgi:trehalose 6-phosphate phosphatase
VALHWRGAEEEERAEALAADLAAAAESDGMLAHRGRKVLEVRPRVAIDKGVAARSLLVEGGLSAALYAGDDRTDLDAFATLRELEREGVLDAARCVAVASAEAPSELVPQADLVVPGTEGFLRVLELLKR